MTLSPERIAEIESRNEHWPRNIGQASEDIDALLSSHKSLVDEIERLRKVLDTAEQKAQEGYDNAGYSDQRYAQGVFGGQLDMIKAIRTALNHTADHLKGKS